MTREEAIAKMKSAVPMQVGVVEQNYINFVECLAALGVLKLDEPMSVRTKTLDALFKQFGGHDIETMLGLIDEANLKIVEK